MNSDLTLPLHILAVGRFTPFFHMLVFEGNAGFAAGSWPANNQAIYSPVNMPAPFTISRFMACNGANITGNTDVGLYHSSFTRLLSTGTIARANASVVQYFSVTAQRFPAGDYYLGIVLSSTTGTLIGTVMADSVNTMGCGLLQEALGSTVLPATMTPVRLSGASAAVGWHYGFTQSATL